MLRFIPFIACFVVGLVVGVVLTCRRGGQSSSSADWERKYRELDSRYRALSSRIDAPTRTADPKASIYRSLLYDAAHFLEHPDRVTPPDREATLRAIKTALDGGE